jgi:uncharacterized membrane protein
MAVRSLLGPVCLLFFSACAAAAASPPPVAPEAGVVVAPAVATSTSTSAPTPTPTSAGCAKLGALACEGAAPKYASDVRAVLERRCFGCHANDGIAADEHDFSKYGVAHAQRVEIAAMIKECAMPPKGAAPLPADERRTLLAWAECGAPP